MYLTISPQKLSQKSTNDITSFSKIEHQRHFKEINRYVLEVGQKKVQQSFNEDQYLIFPCPEEDQNLVPNINTYKHINIKKKNKPESEKEVIDFFRSKKWKAVEGQKFFHHYQSIGWKKGGVTPLTDWQAAAESWVLRGMELRALEVPPVRMRIQDNLKITKAKHYDKPL